MISEETSTPECGDEQRLDALGERRVRIADPGDGRLDVERRVERPAVGARHADARFLGDQHRAHVVGVTAKARRLSALGEDPVEERPEIGIEPVVPHAELVELAAGADVLILEAGGAAGRERAEQRAHELFVERGDGVARAGKKARQHREPVLDAFGAGRRELERLALVSEHVAATRRHAAAPHGPELVGQVLFHERDLRLHGQHEIRKACVRNVRRDAGEHPRAALLVHEPARAVDRIDDEKVARRSFLAAARQDQAAALESLGHEHDAAEPDCFALELGDEHFLADAIDRVDGVPSGVARDGRKRPRALGAKSRRHAVADPALQALHERQDEALDFLEEQSAAVHASRSIMAPVLCPHSRRCPGCPLIDLDGPAQLGRKRQAVAQALGAYAALGAAPLGATVPAEPVTGFRVRVKLVADRRALGLFARGTHEVVDIPECRVQRPRVLAVTGALRKSLPLLGPVSSFDVREADEGVLVTAAVDPRIAPAARRALASQIAALDEGIASVAVSTRERDAPQLLGRDLAVLVGPSELRHTPDPGAPFHYAAHGAFTQAHAGQLARLHATLEASLAEAGRPADRPSTASPPRVLELYAGSGALSLRLAARGYAVTLVEAFEPAVRMAERAAAEQGLTLTAVTADAAAALGELARQKARFDAVVVNPPRRGVTPEVRRLLATLEPRRLLYVSCAPETLARDAAHLALLGLALRQVTPFDMIPLSDAVEALAVLEPAPPPPPRVLAEGPSFLVIEKEPHEPVTSGPGAGASLETRVRRLPNAEHALAIDPLDVEASGACLFARGPAYVPALTDSLARGHTEALALVRGVIRAQSKLPERPGLGKTARYERLETGESHSLVVVSAPPPAFADATAAFASFGHPVLGDARRGDRRANVHLGLRHGLDRAFWHRRRLELEVEGAPLAVDCPLAPDLAAVLRSLG
jgi:23S rRNA (uracil1939-C5)-methyltransferase